MSRLKSKRFDFPKSSVLSFLRPRAQARKLPPKTTQRRREFLRMEPLEQRLCLTHVLTTGTDDGGLTVTVDGFGSFGSSVFADSSNAFYNPIGSVGEGGTTFESGIAARVGSSGGRMFLTSGSIGVSGGLTAPAISGNDTLANSSFVVDDFSVNLTQEVRPTFNEEGARAGSELTQTYVITNIGSTSSDLELIRYIDGDLFFDGTLIDGGGRFVTPSGTEFLFETDEGGSGETDTTFVGITAEGGTVPTSGRFEIDSFSGLLDRIEVGTALDDIITGDTSGDEFINAGEEYDVTLALQNEFLIAPGTSVTYVTRTVFGSGAPEEVTETDLVVTKGDSPDPVQVGEALRFDLNVTNNGPDTAVGVVLTDTLPSGFTFVSATADQGSCSESLGIVTCNLGDLAPSASIAATVNVVPTAAGTFTNTAEVSSNTSERDPTNNSVSELTTVTAQATPDLVLSKTDLQDPILSGGEIRYTLEIQNTGGVAATGVVLTDTLPSNVTFVSATSTQGSCTEASGTVSCSLGDLPAGASAQVTLIVVTSVAGSVTNSATVASDVDDTNPADNSASETTTVERFEDAVNRISGTKWEDLNENGMRDSNEPPLAGVTIYLDLNNNGVLDSFEPTQVTDSGGFYQFEQLASGTYSVREVVPSGFEQSFPPTGFSQSTTRSTGTLIGGVVSGDLNGDQLMDLVVANDYSDPSQFASSLTILLNDGQGGFQESSVTLPDNARPQSVFVSDLVGDSLPDLAVTSLGLPNEPTSDTNGVLLLENLGGSSFGNLQFLAVGNGPTDITGADFNLDGITDLVTANHLSDNISVLLGQSGGGFGSAISIPVGAAPLSLAVGDLNHDDEPDLAVGNFNGDSLSILINAAGEEELFNAPLEVTGISSPRDVAIADLDDNGVYDLASISNSTGNLFVGLGNGDGTFNTSSFNVGSSPVSLAVGELTGDMLPDLVIGSGNGSISFFSNSGNGTFESPTEVSLPSFSTINSQIPLVPESLALANVDSVAGLDIIVGHFAGGISIHPFSPGAHVVSIGLTDSSDGNDFGNFIATSFLLSGSGEAEADQSMDVNNDGELTPNDALIVINHLNDDQAEGEDGWQLDVNDDQLITSFDVLLIVNQLNAAAAPHQVSEQLTADQLLATYEAAIAIWEDAGLSESHLEDLRAVDLLIGHLPDSVLASAGENQIAIDMDAGGIGWFIDLSPEDNAEFVTEENGRLEMAAADYVDLLTTVLHEQAHLLGLDHDLETGLLEDSLQPGVRFLPTSQEVDAVMSSLH